MLRSSWAAATLVRGAELAAAGLDRVTGDHMGMLATVMNALAFRDALVRAGRDGAGAFGARDCEHSGGLLDRGRPGEPGERGRSSCLPVARATRCSRRIPRLAYVRSKIGAHAVVKATKVDGVYSADPEEDRRAQRLPELTYRDVLDRRLRVMDLTAITLCEEHGLPVVVCDVAEPGALTRVARGDKVGTRIHAGP